MTVYLDTSDYRRLKSLARAKGRTPAELVREAVATYVATEQPLRRPRSATPTCRRRRIACSRRRCGTTPF